VPEEYSQAAVKKRLDISKTREIRLRPTILKKNAPCVNIPLPGKRTPLHHRGRRGSCGAFVRDFQRKKGGGEEKEGDEIQSQSGVLLDKGVGGNVA